MAHEEIPGGEQRAGVGDGQLVNDDAAHVDVGKLHVEKGSKHLDVQVGLALGDGDEHQLRGVGDEDGNVDDVCVVSGAGNLHFSGEGADLFKKLLASGLGSEGVVL